MDYCYEGFMTFENNNGFVIRTIYQ